MWTKFGSKLQKNLKCGRPGGGGSSVISDTPRRGGGGVKKGQIFADVLYGWPHSVKLVVRLVGRIIGTNSYTWTQLNFYTRNKEDDLMLSMDLKTLLYKIMNYLPRIKQS